jgi:protocatechuate 3,4-dioxygenase beta subunit
MTSRLRLALVFVVLALIAIVVFMLTGSSDKPSAEAPTGPGGKAIGILTAASEFTGSVSGRILDSRGRPIPGALVLATRQKEGHGKDSEEIASPRISDQTGLFQVPGLASGMYVIAATAVGRVGNHVRGIEVMAGRETGDVEIVLGDDGVLLSGRVLDASGGPIEGANLSAFRYARQTSQDASEKILFRVSSDGTGRYEIRLSPGEYHFLIQAGGYASSKLFFHLLTDQTRDFLLEPAAHLSGRILSAETELPIADAHVWAQPIKFRRDYSVPPTRSDQSGYYQLEGLPAGSYRVFARKGELSAGRDQPVSVTGGHNADNIDIYLTRALNLAGHVYTPDKKPIGNVRIGLWPTDWVGTLPHETRTDSDGRYTISGIIPGQHQASLSVDGYVAVLEEILIAANHERDFILRPTGSLSGTVLTSSGANAVGADVEVRVRPAASGRMDVQRAKTDGAGSFTFRRLPPGEAIIAARTADEVGEAGPISVDTTEDRRVEVRLKAGGRISGEVVWSDNRPALGIRVIAKLSSDNRVMAEARSTGTGSFTIGPLAPGSLIVFADSGPQADRGSSQSRGDQREVTVVAGQQVLGVRLMVSGADSTIAGAVMAPDGNPIAGAAVELGDAESQKSGLNAATASTDATGRFEIPTQGTGPFSVRASHPDYADAMERNVKPGSSNLRLVLSTGASIAGSVFTAQRTPAVGYSLLALLHSTPTESATRRLQGVGGSRQSAQRIFDPKGEFKLDRLRPGTYDLVATTLQGEVARMEGLHLGAGEKKHGIRLQIEPGSTVVGTAVDAELGTGIAGIDVAVWLPAGSIKTVTSSAGSFTLENVPLVAGLELHVARDQDGRYLPETVSLPGSRNERHDLGAIRVLRTDPKNPMKGKMGLSYSERDGAITIRDVAANAPASAAGVRPGDVVLAVNGERITGGIPELVSKMRVEFGKQISVTVQSANQPPREVKFGRIP